MYIYRINIMYALYMYKVQSINIYHIYIIQFNISTCNIYE